MHVYCMPTATSVSIVSAPMLRPTPSYTAEQQISYCAVMTSVITT